MDVTNLINALNDPQRQAVTAPVKNLLILAGAGSGKTRVLVHRIAWLIQIENISPYSILAVTFTNKAAKEMRGRIEHLLGIPTQGMWVGTFHGLAHRLLRSHWKEAGLAENFQIMDSDDQLRLIKRLCKDMQLDEQRWPARQFQWYINAQKDEGLRSRHQQTLNDPYLQTMTNVYQAYEQACERGGMIDFGELLLRSLELLRDKSPSLLHHYRERFRYLLVDEFQDTNAIQYAWLRLLAQGESKLMAVGDDDQSIYGWRGAKIENIQSLSQHFPNTETIRLEQNYRSTQMILGAANAVIEHNQDRLGKKLWTDDQQGEPLSLYSAFNEQDEARFIVDRILQCVEQGQRKDECAILYRSNAQSRVLEEALLRMSIPYRIYGGQRFYDRLEIKNALAYLRLIANTHDDTAMERVINVPVRGIGTRTIEHIRERARQENISLWLAMHELIQLKRLTPKATSALQSFIILISSLSDNYQNMPLHELTDLVIETTGLIQHHQKEQGEKGQSRVDNLEELVTASGQFERQWQAQADDQNTSVLSAFLDQAALDAGDTQADRFTDSVQLMTLHSSKGLEFTTVFLCGMEDGLFPHSMSAEEPGRMEEERRLCYVGMTRAMKKLYLTLAEARRLHGQEKYNRPSRFINEIPSEYIEEVRLNNSVSRPLTSRTSSYSKDYSALGQQTTFNPKIDSLPEIHLGQRVLHPSFGEGTVINIEGNGPKARIQINFDDQGSKWLVVGFAKLQGI